MAGALQSTDPNLPKLSSLERAHALCHKAARTLELASEPPADLTPALASIRSGLTALYDAIDGRADRATAVNVAHGRFWEAAISMAHAAESTALEPLFEACRELILAESAVLSADLPKPFQPLTAGSNEPGVHHLPRPSIAPIFRAPKPAVKLPSPTLPIVKPATSFDELKKAADLLRKKAQSQAHSVKTKLALSRKPTLKKRPPPEEPPPGFAETPPPAETEKQFVERWARICYEEIGMLGVQRAPLENETFRNCQVLEQRLVTALDALAALGPTALTQVEKLTFDAPTPDPMRAFAVACIGGFFQGRDAIAMAERAIVRFGVSDPLLALAFSDAVRIGQNSFLPSVLRSLASLGDASLTEFAIPLLAEKGALSAQELTALVSDPSPTIGASALTVMGLSHHPDLHRAVSHALASTHGKVVEAALHAMLLSSNPAASRASREALSSPLGVRALVYTAIAGHEDDAKSLVEKASSHLTVELAGALGWAGHVGAVSHLVAGLSSDNADLTAACALALERLLGANLTETVQIDPQVLDDVPVVDPEPKRVRPTLDDEVNDPRDKAPKGSTETLEVPSRDPEKWRLFWAERAASFNPTVRFRRGKPHCSAVSLFELDQLPLPASDRVLLHRELCYLTGQILPFHPSHFVATQERYLRAWQTVVERSNETPGKWVFTPPSKEP